MTYWLKSCRYDTAPRTAEEMADNMPWCSRKMVETPVWDARQAVLVRI